MEALIIVLIILLVITVAILIWVLLYYQNKERIQKNQQMHPLTIQTIDATRIITDKPEPIHRVIIDGIVYKCLVHPSDCKHKYETVQNGLTKIKVCVGCGLTQDEVKKYIEECNLHCDHFYMPESINGIPSGYYGCINCGLLVDAQTGSDYIKNKSGKINSKIPQPPEPAPPPKGRELGKEISE